MYIMYKRKGILNLNNTHDIRHCNLFKQQKSLFTNLNTFLHQALIESSILDIPPCCSINSSVEGKTIIELQRHLRTTLA